MNALQTPATRHTPEAATGASAFEAPSQPLAPPRWDWGKVRRVLVVRLRSIGDTVLSTPSLYALRRFLPDAQIDLLLEDWVAPLLDGNRDASRILTVRRDSSTTARLALARRLHAARYDVAFNLHGGSTAALLTRATGAHRRVGYASYRFSALHNYAAPPATDLWRQPRTHSAEQQLGLLGWAGVPVTDRPATRLFVTDEADARVARRLDTAGVPASQPFALFHPAAAFDSKRWDARNFARVADRLHTRGFAVVAVAAPGEIEVVRAFDASAQARVVSFNDLSLPEVTALAARARLFVGNDSGIAHIAAAVRAPSVVVFGSSNIAHWRPWTDAPAEVVREEMPCAPCAGYTCGEFAEAQCIRRVTVERVEAAVERVLHANS